MIMHVIFDVVGASVVNVGCVLQNTQSLCSIEKYIERYNGSFCGLIPTTENRFHYTYDLHQTVLHIEFSVTKKQYDSQDKGISCTVPGVSYDDVKDKLRVDSSTENS